MPLTDNQPKNTAPVGPALEEEKIITPAVIQLPERLRVIGAQQKRAANLPAAENTLFRSWKKRPGTEKSD
jgi:hypothetical protein